MASQSWCLTHGISSGISNCCNCTSHRDAVIVAIDVATRVPASVPESPVALLKQMTLSFFENKESSSNVP